MDDIEQSSCEPEVDYRCNKTHYDKKGAMSLINKLQKQRGRHSRPTKFRAYHCPECNSWHITKDNDEHLK